MEQSFIVSARKYRPEDWESVVGQEAIASTLKNAISNNHLASAYLFCGPRGVGKTSCARIFAREVNKEHAAENDDFAFNIFELDAASNNKVEHIRSLIDQVRVPPQRGKYKVYIIDEVHMLSTAAFNAFLKTLEEPPAHAIFILATTEKHKIIPTILSRCQIFDFRRIGIDDIAAHLERIAEKEGIQFEKEALHVIAQKADGALRDALSIFDQLASFTGRNLSYEAVIRNLNVLDHTYFFRLMDQVLSEDIRSAMLLLDDVIAKGFDPHHFVQGLGEHVRNLMMARDPETVRLMEVAENVREQLIEQSGRCDIYLIVQALEFITKCDQQYKNSMNQRLSVELMLMQLCSIPQNLREKKKPEGDLSEFRLIAPPGVSLRESIKPEPKPQAETIAPKLVPDRSPQRRQAPIGKSAPRPADRISLSDLLKEESIEVAEAEKEQGHGELAEEPVTKEGLLIAWKELAEGLKEDKGHNIYSILTAEEPELKPGPEVILRLTNSAQQLAIDTIRQELADQLRLLLRNRSVVLQTVLVKDGVAQTAEVTLMGDRAKYEIMVKQNPALERLRVALKLDFED